MNQPEVFARNDPGRDQHFCWNSNYGHIAIFIIPRSHLHLPKLSKLGLHKTFVN